MSKRRREKKRNRQILKAVSQFLNNSSEEKSAPQAYIDYFIMTQLWHCPPSVFAEQPMDIIDLHRWIYNLEAKAKQKMARRQEQAMKAHNKTR